MNPNRRSTSNDLRDTFVSSSFTLRNTPRRIRLLVISANQRSTRLIQEP